MSNPPPVMKLTNGTISALFGSLKKIINGVYHMRGMLRESHEYFLEAESVHIWVRIRCYAIYILSYRIEPSIFCSFFWTSVLHLQYQYSKFLSKYYTWSSGSMYGRFLELSKFYGFVVLFSKIIEYRERLWFVQIHKDSEFQRNKLLINKRSYLIPNGQSTPKPEPVEQKAGGIWYQ